MYKFYVLVIFFIVEYTNSQSVIGMRKDTHNLLLSCENSSYTELIEHFFNVIFTEFRSSPPVCVCVQMCLGQSTYCYPNGCLRKNEDEKYVKGQSRQQFPIRDVANDVPTPFLFVVHEPNDFMKEYIESRRTIDSKPVETTLLLKDMIPDILQDRYTTLFGYKKPPRVDIKYGLREPIKAKFERIKLERADISRTRWPMNKYNKLNVKPLYIETQYEKEAARSGNPEYPPMLLEDFKLYYESSKTMKRDLTNIHTYGLAEPNTKFDIVTENASLFLDNLIEEILDMSGESKTNISLIVKERDAIDHIDNITTATDAILNTDPVLNFVNESNIPTIIIPGDQHIADQNEHGMNDTVAVENIGNIINELLYSFTNNIETYDNTSEEVMKFELNNEFNLENTNVLYNSNNILEDIKAIPTSVNVRIAIDQIDQNIKLKSNISSNELITTVQTTDLNNTITNEVTNVTKQII